ncbi:MarR family winged helix-turn-helix transcriptional regulator [Yinghuangia seranimata]|uniref:MarR family winged helix-turn-helix transcriptional regulator n=1 Tax=Yinghuangia seranimata TaxID=408067 RepID=UPI00248C332D|nr:MarR family transcriptional regulator [Yinghuangia seranimata]MDI2126497.1 MarR family transcriptional regulator [Yinghuangia seranimata]
MHKDRVDAIGDQWRRERPDLGDLLAMEVFGRIYRIADAVGNRMEEAYGCFGIGRGEFDVLATLRRSGEPYRLTPKQLAGTLMLTTGGMTGRLDKLEKSGLIAREPDPDDRRSVRARLTPEGRELVDNAVAAGLEVQRAVLGRLSPDDAKLLGNLLRELLDAAR